MGVKAYSMDHLGTVINGEAVSEKGVTGPFGEQLGSDLVYSQSSAPVRYGYTGREVDSESKTYYYRARSYDQDSGRFLAEDIIGTSDDFNLYRYVGNRSTSLIDPLGLFKLTVFTGPTVSGGAEAGADAISGKFSEYDLKI